MGCFQAVQPTVGKEFVGPAMMIQAEPLVSFDPLFEGCQHPWCPNPWFHPVPSEQDVSGTCSPRGHCLRLFFRRFGHHVSTFLRPLAPPELPGLLATMGALTPGRPALRLPREHEHRLWRRPGLHASCHRTFRSFRLQPPAVVPTRLWGFLRWAYRTTLPWSPFSRVQASIGLRHYLAGSPRRPAESRSLALRTNRSPPVALHPASRRRSCHWLRSARAPRKGLSPC